VDDAHKGWHPRLHQYPYHIDVFTMPNDDSLFKRLRDRFGSTSHTLPSVDFSKVDTDWAYHFSWPGPDFEFHSIRLFFKTKEEQVILHY